MQLRSYLSIFVNIIIICYIRHVMPFFHVYFLVCLSITSSRRILIQFVNVYTSYKTTKKKIKSLS